MTKSTAVATTEETGVGVLPPELRQAIEYRKMLNLAAAELGKLSWGDKLDQTTRRGVADWAHKFGLDAATEIHILGGTIYPNARYYLRRLGELVAAGVVEYAVADHIAKDGRLETMAEADNEWAVAERERRAQERIMRGIREEALAACVFRIKVRGMDQELVGVKAVYADKADPVGKGNPMETVETRAARRAIRLIASHVPKFAAEEDALVSSAEVISEQVRDGLKRFEELPHGPRPIPRLGAGDDLNNAYSEPAMDRETDLQLDQLLIEQEGEDV